MIKYSLSSLSSSVSAVSLLCSPLKPLQLLIEASLLPAIHDRYQHVCSTLLAVIKEEHKLMDNLAVVRVSGGRGDEGGSCGAGEN